MVEHNFYVKFGATAAKKMDSKNRDRIRDPREEILLETNFDEDGIMTRAYNNNSTNHRRYRSDMSVDRFSESSLHGNNYRGKYNKRTIYIQK